MLGPVEGQRLRYLVLLLVLLGARADAAPRPAGVLARGTAYETPYYRLEGAEPGPTVFVLGGVHGDEPAGYQAARILTHGRVLRGTLVIVPDANRPAIRRGARQSPASISVFYGSTTGRPAQRLVADLWALIRRTGPDVGLTLHESRDFHWRNPRRFGQTFTHDVPDFDAVIGRALARVNPEVVDAQHRFRIFLWPAERRFTWVVSRDLRRPATTIETCRLLPLSLRVRYQLLAVRAFLDEVGVVYENRGVPRLPGTPVFAPAPPPEDPLREYPDLLEPWW